MRLVHVERQETFVCQRNGINWHRKMVKREPPSHYKNTKLHVIDERTIIKEENADETACHHLAEATIPKRAAPVNLMLLFSLRLHVIRELFRWIHSDVFISHTVFRHLYNPDTLDCLAQPIEGCLVCS